MNNEQDMKSDLQMPDKAYRLALRSFAGQGTASMNAEFSEELGAGSSESEVAQWVNKNLGRQAKLK
ncbi:hypothetical protein EJP77_07010 [Paenibacillus zeisoli]|uniref:Uncharacterized protein n=1 Tax=Paenibacillus zeisoli TaxID=2496267 RepID=A0A433XH52_9BACL|nr:hypothetical protein [Paenibacillus zeisoli]RUT33391.1 hypothetical protein EJP77_07010 [Paenibacillus zeisoli]